MPAPRIVEHDPAWIPDAHVWLSRIAEALSALAGSSEFAYDHIGSTAVAGLASKPIIDLQIRTPDVPSSDLIEAPLVGLGFVRARGARPDSPGVAFDIPRPGADPSEALYRKLLFHRPETASEPEIILHIRRADSPFARFVLTFRDWLRASPDHASRYERIKRDLSVEYADAQDYDDYTRAKGDFLDEIQPELDLLTG